MQQEVLLPNEAGLLMKYIEDHPFVVALMQTSLKLDESKQNGHIL
jgi:hypothetical protein